MTLSVMQALATGLPCIATRHSAFPDQIIEGTNGFLVDEGDYKVLAEKILYFINHTELWASMSRAARAHVARTYDNESLIDTQVALYRSLVKSGTKN
jgi:colanic acid/amylovoran biosynthesis glycosyltransferase